MTCESYTPPKPRVYLAAPLFTPYQKDVIDEVLLTMRHVGLNVFSPLHESVHIWKGRPPAECGSEERKAVMEMNKNGIAGSDFVFAWLGGWDPFGSVDNILSQCWPDWNTAHDDDVDGIMEAVKRSVPALPDTGVVWEMGFANSMGIPTLAYLHTGEEGRSFNLMLSETVDGTARGPLELAEKLTDFRDGHYSVQAHEALMSEGAEFSG